MSADDVIARLEEAGRTLLALPLPRAQGHVRAGTWAHLGPMVKDFGFGVGKLRCAPEPAAIDRMDEALIWLSLIPQDKFVLRRIVGARSMVCPMTGRHLYPWRRIATLIGADHKAVQRWHAQGIGIIAERLAECRRAA